MKNVLVIYYSQSGQLARIARTIAQPLIHAQDVAVTFNEFKFATTFPFPLVKTTFFKVFLESFL